MERGDEGVGRKAERTERRESEDLVGTQIEDGGRKDEIGIEN